MSEDPYKVLGVKRDATAEEISRAYRALAKKHHPDLNPGDRKAEEQFKKVAAAYDILGSAEKRAKFDKGEIDAEGRERQHGFYRQHAEAPGGDPYSSGAGFADLDDILGDLFRGGRRPGGGGGGGFRARGADINYELAIEFLEAVNGAKRRFEGPDRKMRELTIPAGVEEGQVLRLRGQGAPGVGGGPAGDAFVMIHVQPHPVFRRAGNDIQIELPVGLGEAILGTKVEVPTSTGSVMLSIPKGSNTGTVLRLRGKGVRGGDLLATLKVVLPERPDEELREFVAGWAAKHRYNARKGWAGGA
jgi:DnaJ-class molecular chaperone